MSYVFEAIIVCCGSLTQIPPGFRLFSFNRTKGLIRVAQRTQPIDQPLLLATARSVSFEAGLAVALLYDDRIGFRSSTIVENGQTVRSFGGDEEVWCLLDNDGNPDLHGPIYNCNSIPAGEEGACARSAIDFGLSALGLDGDESSALVDFLRNEC